jgi:DHA1 family tetracycline resistance protein-like MFS transporter
MLPRRYFAFLKDPLWSKVLVLATVLFFVFLSDAVLSFWVPNFLETSLKSPLAMGLVMSASSVVGLGLDLILPQVIKGVTVKQLVFLAIATSLTFSLFLLEATWVPIVTIFLLAMATWGIYYELLGFAQQQFVADATPLQFHPAAWGILGVFRSLAYFLGPLLGGLLLGLGVRVPVFVGLGFAFISLIILVFYGTAHDRPMEIDAHQVSLWREIEHWKVLFKHVWPVLVLSLFLGLIDATFWTIGAVWTEELSQKHWLGGAFLSIYVLPSIFMGFVVAKWGIYKGKKRAAMKFLIASGLLLAALGVSDSIPWQILVVFLSSVALAIVYPLTDGVYSDIVARMGRERRHMMGLSSSTLSLAYIVGPPLAGAAAQIVGEQMTFAVVGVASILVAVALLAFTPRKLKIPQSQVQSWEG